MPSLRDHGIDWAVHAADPAVRAAEQAIVARSAAPLAETLAVSTATETRRRLSEVLDLRDRAEDDPALRPRYQQAADELRTWAARVYLSALNEMGRPPHGDDSAARRS